MAYVVPHRNRIAITINHAGKRRRTTVAYTPTQANLAEVQKRANQAEFRLKNGDAWELVRAILREEKLDQSAHAATSENTLAYWAQHYLDVVAPDHDQVTDSTLMGYQSVFNAHWRHFSNRPIESLTVEELQRHLSNRPVGSKTKREALSLLKRIFMCAKVNTLNDWKIKKSKREKTTDPDPYTFAERDALIRALSDWPIAQRYFTLGFYTGMRTGEMLGLHWNDYVKNDGLDVWQSMSRRKLRPHTKTDRRYVLAHEKVIELMRDNPTQFEGGLVFKTPEGHMFKDADWLMDKWNKAHLKANVRKRLGPYQWRHTYISMCLSGGMSIYDVAKQAGNSPQVIEQNYEQWIPKQAYVERLRKQLRDAL